MDWPRLLAWLGLAANSDGWNGIAQMPMLCHVAAGTERHEIFKRVIYLLALFSFW